MSVDQSVYVDRILSAILQAEREAANARARLAYRDFRDNPIHQATRDALHACRDEIRARRAHLHKVNSAARRKTILAHRANRKREKEKPQPKPELFHIRDL